MEGDLRGSPDFQMGADGGDDMKVLAGLSTVLVATVQEIKDRISHIEFIFCSQLFPRIQLRSRMKNLSAADARRAAAEEWRGKEASLLRQIEELRLGKQRAEEEASRLAASVERERAEAAGRHEAEKALLLAKLEDAGKGNGTVVSELREQLRIRAEEVALGQELRGRILEEFDLKELELSEEKRKRKQLAWSCAKLEEMYKHLKSQYSFLLRKAGLMPEFKDGMDGETCSPLTLPNKRKTPQDLESGDQVGNPLAPKTDGLEDDCGVPGKGPSSNATSHSDPATADSPRSQRCLVNSKPELSAGQKSTISSWVDTRARQEAKGVDPHDDFLDTPLETIRGNLKKMPDVEPHGIPDLPPKGLDPNDSDGETKEMNDDPSVQNPQISLLKTEKKGFKYVEPVRKKAERENLKGVECNQCKKFYDAVLPNDRGKDRKGRSGDLCEVRCEHHEGVSRHRYRYIPPMTPEGFWNIGFDSEM
uniref:Protein gamma response 1 n=1 Tax=Anthurium amnicola TaxID=1678845 RepID=A0A1D1YKX0_9ARAE